MHAWYYYLIPLVLTVLFVFIIDFYVDSYVTHKTDIQYSSKYGTIFMFITGLCLSYVWNHPHVIKIVVMDKIKTIIAEEHAVSLGVIFVFVFFMIGKCLVMILKCFYKDKVRH